MGGRIELMNYVFRLLFLGGENSGASQPHKHVQFIPVDEDYDAPPIEELAKNAQLESQGELYAFALKYLVKK